MSPVLKEEEAWNCELTEYSSHEMDVNCVRWNPKVTTILNRVVPDTDLTGYPANSFAGYRISDRPDNRISG